MTESQLSKEAIDELINEYKRYKKSLTYESDKKLETLTMNFIRERKIIIYGGYAIDKLIKKASGGKDSYYDGTIDSIDFDVYSLNYIKDSEDLAKLYKENGFGHIRIISGMRGNTRKIFIELDPNAYIDINEMTPENFDRHVALGLQNIDGIMYAHPNFLKIDQYLNLSTNLFVDYYRMEKAYKKMSLLEKYYPITKRGILPKWKIYPIEQNCIISGDMAYNYYINGAIKGEAIEYSLDLGETFYLPYGNCKMAVPPMILYHYYLDKFERNTNEHDDKIANLVEYINNLGLYPKNTTIHIPQIKSIQKKQKGLPTFYIE